jgi:signal transduction histidine kinase
MLTLFVAMAIVLVGDDFVRRQVTREVSQTQARDLTLLAQSLHSSTLDLSAQSARDQLRVIVATADFEAAARNAMFGVDAARLEVYSLDGDRVFSSSPSVTPLAGPVREAFEEARSMGRASVLDGRSTSLFSTGAQTNMLTTFHRITDSAPGSGRPGNAIMVAALTTDVSDDMAASQNAVWWTAGTFTAGMVVILTVVYWVSERSRRRLQAANATLTAQNAAVRESRERMLRTADDTKRAIAEELHGAIQTKLYALWMRLSDLRARLPSGAEHFSNEIDGIIEEVDRIREEDIRALSHRLHPGIVRVSAAAGLRSLCNFYDSMVPVDLHIGEAVQELEPAGMSKIPETVRLAAYRIAELALGNVARHSKARNCSVTFDYSWEAGQLQLVIEDDGQGFETSGFMPVGLGVVTMNDYADALGGALAVTSAPGRGTKVHVTIPFIPAGAHGGRAARSSTGAPGPAGASLAHTHAAPATAD